MGQKKPFDLSDNTVLITGAAGLLGSEHVEAVLAINARVIATDISGPALKKLASRFSEAVERGQLLFERLDVSDEKAVAECVRKLKQKSSFVDVLVNNAAVDAKVKPGKISTDSKRLETFDLHQWTHELNVSLTGAFLCCKHFGLEMADRNYGNIVNVCSDLSVIAPNQSLYKLDGLEAHQQPVKPVTYSVIKAGLHGLTRYMSTYWAANGVRCNSLSPGAVQSGQGEQFVKRIEQLIPLQRMAQPNEYQAALQFLCSEASSYLNGHNLIMDGGRTVL